MRTHCEVLLETLKAKKEYTFYPSTIGTKGFHYPDYKLSGSLTVEVDTALQYLPFVCLEDRTLNAYQVPPELAAFLKLNVPVIWIAK